jgi:hypothetical protein
MLRRRWVQSVREQSKEASRYVDRARQDGGEVNTFSRNHAFTLMWLAVGPLATGVETAASCMRHDVFALSSNTGCFALRALVRCFRGVTGFCTEKRIKWSYQQVVSRFVCPVVQRPKEGAVEL